MSKIDSIVHELVKDGKIDSFEAIAIVRCLTYSDQIADISIGNVYRPDIARLLADVT